MATPCPSCGLAMATMRLERRPFGEASIDACAGCRALWFDGFESAMTYEVRDLKVTADDEVAFCPPPTTRA